MSKKSSHTLEHVDKVVLGADWRFLLNSPIPKRSLCLATSGLAKTVQEISKSTNLSKINAGSNEFDLVVMSDPDDNDLTYARSVLKPGGACFLEWTANILFKSSSIEDKLKKAGLEIIDQYIPKPNPDNGRPRILIPFKFNGALQYVFTYSYQSRDKSIYWRAGFFLRHAIWLLAPRFFINFPWIISSGISKFKVYTIARKPGRSEEASDTMLLKDKLLELNELATNNNYGEGIDELGIMIISAGSHLLNKIILVVFKHGSNIPLYIIKIPRIKDSELSLQNEANVLKVLHSDYKHINGIPKVLFSDDRLGYYSVAETVIVGKPLGNILNYSNSSKFAKIVTVWLSELAKKTAVPIPDKWWNTYIQPLIEELKLHIPQFNERSLINEIFINFEIPNLICEHRDCSPWNILISSGEDIGVLDWESSRLDGIPGLDLIYFFTYLCIYIEDAWTTDTALRCYKKMLDKDSFTGSLFNECFEIYATEIGLPLQSFHPLRIVTWATHLSTVLKQASINDQFQDDLDHDTKNLCLTFLKYELSCL